MAADIFISYAREDEATAIHLRVLVGQVPTRELQTDPDWSCYFFSLSPAFCACS